jgi:hypothetical protein
MPVVTDTGVINIVPELLLHFGSVTHVICCMSGSYSTHVYILLAEGTVETIYFWQTFDEVNKVFCESKSRSATKNI